MRTKFTSEKNKQLKNENESMFNFKMFSLMKKQVFTLMMAFALVMGLSVSAFAQAGDGTNGNPVTHVTGATHTYTVTSDGGGSFNWSVLRDVDGTVADVADYVIVSGGDAATLTLTWTDEAAGLYIVRVVDENTTTGCTTTRDFYVNVFTFDVWVYASNSLGDPLTAGNFGDCGDNNGNSDYIFDNALTDADVSSPSDDGSLQTVLGNIGSERWISFEVKFDGDLDEDPTYASIDFDYVVTAHYTDGTTVATSDLQEFNEETAITGNSSINRDGTSNVMTTNIVWNDRWGAANDIIFSVTATNIRLRAEAGGAGTIVGKERLNKEGAQGERIDPDGQDANTSDNVTIYAAPATSTISVN